MFNAIVHTCVYAGIKFIPLRTPGGDFIPGSGLFVRIKKTAAATKREATERETTKAVPATHRVSRQDAVDIGSRATVRDAAAKVNVTEDGEDDEKGGYEDESFGSEDKTVSYKRRFSSPTSLEGSGDPFKDYHDSSNSKLAAAAEVHETLAL